MEIPRMTQQPIKRQEKPTKEIFMIGLNLPAMQRTKKMANQSRNRRLIQLQSTIYRK